MTRFAGLMSLVLPAVLLASSPPARGAGLDENLEAPAGHGKPQPGVSVVWRPVDPLVPGTEARVTLEIRARVPVQRIELTFPEPSRDALVGVWPRYSGRPAPGEALTFPMRFRVPTRDMPAVAARVEVESEVGRYTVGAYLDLAAPVSGRAVPGRDRVAGLVEPTEFQAIRADQEGGIAPRVSPEEGSFLVYGRFLYRDRVLDPRGFANPDPQDDPVRAIRFADVDLLENGIVVDAGFTDAFGVFVFSVTPAAGTETYQVRVRSRSSAWEGTDLFVLNAPSNSTPALAVTPAIPAPTHDLYAGDYLVEPREGGESFNILDSCVNGVLFVGNLEGAFPTAPLVVFWNASSTEETRFHLEDKTIFLSGDEGYDDPVILHEFGHYIMRTYSRDDSPGGVHFVDEINQDPRLSWSEGFASYFQSSVRGWLGEPYPTWYIDTMGTPGKGQLIFSYDCEGPSYSVRGPGSEVAVQAMLWDIEDGPSIPGDIRPGFDDDALQLSTLQVWEVLTGPIRTAVDVTLEDFWDGWFSPGIDNGHLEDMRTTFTALGAEYEPDSFEDDDPTGSPTWILLDGIPGHHTFFPDGDEDHFWLVLEKDAEVTVETLNILGFGDTQLEVYDTRSNLIAANDDRSESDFSSMIAFTAPETGSYSVVVKRSNHGSKSRFVRYGSYDIRALAGAPNQNALNLLSSSTGVADAGFGVGVALADYNRNGYLDIYLVNNPAYGAGSGADALFRNLSSLRFIDQTAEVGLGSPEGGVGAAWGDFDNDDDPDLFVTDHGLYRNEGDGTFVDVTQASGVVDVGREFDAQWVDADVDGLLDLFVVRRDGPSALWHNNGDGTFTNLSREAGFEFPADGRDAYSCSWGDYNGDFLPDLFMTHRTGATHSLYRNLGGNRFEDVTLSAGVGSDVPAVSGVWGDINGDGLLDLFVAATGRNCLYLNRGDGTFREESARYGVDHPGSAEGAAMADYDLDGDLDLYVVNLTGADVLFENLGYSMIRTNQGGDPGIGFGCVWGDLDNDGDEDLYVSRGCGASCETNRLYENTSSEISGNGWLKVRLRGNASNRDGLGAEVRLYTSGGVQIRQAGTGVGWASKSLTPLTFGLPGGEPPDSVVVWWPAGGRSRVTHPEPNQLLEVIEDDVTPVLPGEPTVHLPLRVSQASPNPFAGATTLNFTVSTRTRVVVEVFDLSGRRVRRLLDREMGEGTHVLGWDGLDDQGRGTATGIYFYRVRTPNEVRVRKLVRVGG